MEVKPGASATSDRLPPGLVSGPPGLLIYRVQLRNAAGRTAGPSAAAFTASGAGPEPVAELRVTATKAGALLRWTEETGEGGSVGLGRAESVEMDRVQMDPAGEASARPVNPGGAVASVAGGSTEGTQGKSALVGAQDGAAPVRFRVSWGGGRDTAGQGSARTGGDLQRDPGGALDRTAKTGQIYRYTAERVWTTLLAGHSVEVRSAASQSKTVAMVDTFPPERPVGLAAAPGFAGEGEARRASIDLVWEPVVEPGTETGVAGYVVYRRELDGEGGGTARRLNEELVPVPAYRDLTVAAGRRYGYRVTAVDAAGNESKKSDEVVETAPGE
jgi:hypothetical protein